MPSEDSCEASAALMVVPQVVPLVSLTVYPIEVELPACTLAVLGLICICDVPIPEAYA
jgi:hypothetical protein